MSSVDTTLVDKVLRTLRAPHFAEPERPLGELLSASGAAYGARPSDNDRTSPSGFDPLAAALFEAVVEAVFLVAMADGEFDERERGVLVSVVQAATSSAVSERKVEALLADLQQQLLEDGVEARVAWVAKMVRKPEQKADVLHIAAILAHASAGVSDVERDLLLQLGHAMGIEATAVDSALASAASALALFGFLSRGRPEHVEAARALDRGPLLARLGPRFSHPHGEPPPSRPHDWPSAFAQRRFGARRPPRPSGRRLAGPSDRSGALRSRDAGAIRNHGAHPHPR